MTISSALKKKEKKGSVRKWRIKKVTEQKCAEAEAKDNKIQHQMDLFVVDALTRVILGDPFDSVSILQTFLYYCCDK